MSTDHESLTAKRQRQPGTSAIDRTTIPIVETTTGAPPSPIIGLHVIPTGPRCLFQALESRTRRNRYLVIGTADDCDIRLHDASVSAHHCAIVRRRSRVYASDLGSTNGVWSGGRRVQSCELHDGTVITLGNTGIAAIGREAMGHEVVIAAATVHAFIRKAVAAYGSMHAAADGIGIPYSTLRDWLKKKRTSPHGE